MARSSSGIDSARAEAPDDYRTAAMLAALVLAWGTLSLSRGPALPWPMRAGYLFQIALAAVGLLLFERTWRRPALLPTRWFTAIQTALWLLLVSISCWSWARAGFTQDATIGVQIALLAIPLIVPRGLGFGLALVSFFAGEAIVIALHAKATEVPRIVPVEPFISLIFAVHAVVQLVLHDRQRHTVLKYGLLAAEEAALEQLGPRLAMAGADLGQHLRQLSVATRGLSEAGSGPVQRALGRLGVVHARMDALAREASNASPASAELWEERVRARHGQMSAVAFGIFALLATLLASASLPEQPTEALVAVGTFGAAAMALLIYLVSMRKHPSERGAVFASTIAFFVVLVGVAYVHWCFSVYGYLHRPFRPFVGHKLLAVSIGTIGPARPRTVTALVAAAMASALFFYVVGFNPPVQVPSIEPWATLLVAALGFGYLHLREDRRHTTVSVLHAEATIRALRRRAMLFFAVRDQLNSPLQTLILGLARVESKGENTEAVREAIDGLVGLANDLARLQSKVPSEPASFDASEELEPRLSALRESTSR